MGRRSTGVSSGVRFLTILVCLIGALIPITAAHADLPDPDTVEIEAVRVFRHMLEANDTLVVARYNVHYGNSSQQPTQPIDRTFEFLYIDAGNCTVGNITAYPFHNQGYDLGVVAFYFGANNTACAGNATPTWGEAGNITVIGSALFDDPKPTDSYILTSDDWSPYSSPADIREDLRGFIISNALFLELNWNEFWIDFGADNRQLSMVDYIAPYYTVLAPAGEGYFTVVISDLRDMCPLLFSIQIIDPAYADKTFTQSLSDTYKSTYDDTPVGVFQEALSDMFGGVGEQVMGTIVTIIIMILLMAYCAKKWGRASPWLLISFPAVIILVRMGFTEMSLMFLAAALGVLLIAYAFFFSKGQG